MRKIDDGEEKKKKQKKITVEIRLAKPASRAGAGAWLGLAWQK